MKRAAVLPLQESVKNIRHPTVLKLVDGSLEIPCGKRFTVGDTLVAFSFTKCLNISCDTQTDGEVKKHVSLLPLDSDLNFYDKHCVNQSYHDLKTLSKDFPRYIKSNEDFFAPCEDENLCQIKKITAGEILELKEIRIHRETVEHNNTYTNVNALCQSLVCRLSSDTENVDVLLQSTLKLSLMSVPDTTEYTITEITERFQLPRKVQFCDERLDKSVSKLTNSDVITVVSETEPKFFFSDPKDLKISSHDNILNLCENVFCLENDFIEMSNAGVEVLEGENIYKNIQPIFITKQPSRNCFQLYVMDPPNLKKRSSDNYITLWPKGDTVPAPLLQCSEQHEDESQPEMAEAEETSESSIEDMNVTELCAFLVKYKLSNLADICNSEMIDGQFLGELKDSDLKDEPFCMRVFDIKKLNKLKTGWRPSL